MSSGFISEAEIAANKQKRQEEWEKVRQPDQPLEVEEAPYDSRSLYEKLKEQKDKKDYEFEEAHKLKNLIRGLDDEEVDFLHVIDKAKATADHQQHMEAEAELREYRQQVASMQERNQETKLQAEIASKNKPAQPKLSTRPSQKSILSGSVVVRKRHAPAASSDGASTSAQSGSKTPSPSTATVTDTKTTTPETSSNTGASSPEVKKSPPVVAGAGLRCIGVLPGVGRYSCDSSDSDNSSNSDADEVGHDAHDWLGRPVKRQCGGAGGSGEAGGH